jgi:hypothetical protein
MIRHKVRCVTVASGRDPYTLEQLANVMLDNLVDYVKSKGIDFVAEQSVVDTRIAHGRVRLDQLLHTAVSYRPGL